MACGPPVVASATGDLIDIVLDGTTGVLVPPRDLRCSLTPSMICSPTPCGWTASALPPRTGLALGTRGHGSLRRSRTHTSVSSRGELGVSTFG
jgi:hypothetical protein